MARPANGSRQHDSNPRNRARPGSHSGDWKISAGRGFMAGAAFFVLSLLGAANPFRKPSRGSSSRAWRSAAPRWYSAAQEIFSPKPPSGCGGDLVCQSACGGSTRPGDLPIWIASGRFEKLPDLISRHRQWRRGTECGRLGFEVVSANP